jgi:hypothetical protein
VPGTGRGDSWKPVRDEGAESAQQVGNGASARGEDGSDDEQLGASKSGLGEGRGQLGEYRQGVGEYTGHESLLARRSQVVVPLPRIPPRRPLSSPQHPSWKPSKSAKVELSDDEIAESAEFTDGARTDETIQFSFSGDGARAELA